ncbi:MAG: STAS domain-containing protein [Planctomycetota bacterium]|jgi:anti-anti-sigma regulatory factor|nr:STAS domain-containing protein [Planctomycetota bacterium]MDP6502438.1 STAS domain-containing protein [Planctomycetota bacterium]
MINIRKTDEATILEITEDLLTPRQADQLDKTLEEVVREAELVIVNLSQVKFVNPKSWGVIVARAAEFRRENKKDVKLVGLAPQIRRAIVERVKGDDVVETYETEDDAIQSYSGNVSKVERNILFGFK